jgi:hypothetical protein
MLFLENVLKQIERLVRVSDDVIVNDNSHGELSAAAPNMKDVQINSERIYWLDMR